MIDQQVQVTEYFIPEFSLSSFFASLGGCVSANQSLVSRSSFIIIDQSDPNIILTDQS